MQALWLKLDKTENLFVELSLVFFQLHLSYNIASFSKYRSSVPHGLPHIKGPWHARYSAEPHYW